MLLALTAVMLCAAVESPELQKAEALFAAYKYPEAVKALQAARNVKGLEREQLLRILELTGVAQAQQRQTEAAKAAFRELLALDPARQLDADYAPRVMTPFFEARGEANEKGALELSVDPPVTGAGNVASIGVRIKDPWAMARQVRFHVEGTVTNVPVKGALVTLPVKGGEVRWWAELLGDNESVLQRLGSEAEPQVAKAPVDAPVVAAAPPLSSPSLEPLRVEPGQGTTALRGVSYGVMGAGVVAAGVALAFGLGSNDAFGRIKTAERNGSDVVIGLSEREATQLQAQGRQSAMISNALWVTSGVLLAGGVVMWLLGSAPVAVTPTANGVAVTGVLP